MDHRSENVEVVRSVGSPSVDEETLEKNVSPVNDDDGNDGGEDGGGSGGEGEKEDDAVPMVQKNLEDEGDLPQCKIKRNYSCNLCPFFSQNPRSFLYHSRDVHFDKIKIYECSQCLYASKHSQKLQRHISMIHVPGKTRKARNRMMRSDRKEPRPIRPKPPDKSPDSPSKAFPILTEEEKTKFDTNNGDLEKTVDGEFQCSACSFKHRNPKLLRRHEKVVHMKKRFLKCSKCSYITHVTARFTKHVKYHSMPMIKCDLCDFRTPYKWNLDRHYKNHSGTGAFQCAKCNFRADIKQSLTVHEMNHHVPPVGQGAVMARKRNRVGASELQAMECDQEDLIMTSIEKEESELGPDQEAESMEKESDPPPNIQNLRNVKLPHNTKRESSSSNSFQADFIHPDDIVPRYGQIYVKNLKCKFCSYKAVFSHEIWRHEKRIHGYIRAENKKENVTKRPPPRLIPIQNKSSAGAILKIPTVKNKSSVPSPEVSPVEKPVNEKEFNEMCKKSSLTSSLKDFVSLIGDEEGLKTIPDSSREDLDEECLGLMQSSENKSEDSGKQKQTDLLKKKNASFFDKLKEKLLTGNNEEQSLFCEVCGHESKCLSEAVAHQKRHPTSSNKLESDNHMENDIVYSGTELSSTRCQHCRQRCKTSTDLINHLKICKAFEASLDSHNNSEDVPESKIRTEDIETEEESELKIDEGEQPMENRVFVWNDISQLRKDDEEINGMEVDAPVNEDTIVTSPGYGTVTSKGSDNTESGTLVMEADPRLSVIVKKVFKCPHCSFWASTASRFHVHIVGHLNKKPFECSLCLYRSNWRWDITKHIRLKSLRDPSHEQAKVNMTDETGRRNYSKYNKFLTMMRVQEPTAESSGYGRRSRCGDTTPGNSTEKESEFPAPPRLSKALTQGMSSGSSLRPPPLLKPAHLSDQTQSKSPKDSGKKTFWKCKKCNFRDTQKGRVLLHVKKHYMAKKNELPPNTPGKNDSQDESNSELKTLLKTPSYSCGLCHQVSNWKNVIQRHCKLKHKSESLVEVKWDEDEEEEDKTKSQEERTSDQAKIISCDICPFTADSEGDLTAHKLNHVDRPGSIFKCSYCPFYVPSKIAVLEHMEIHGINEDTDLTSLKVDSFDPSEEMRPTDNGSSKVTPKKFKCLQCPYISNSRSQFLYHKQFHKPRTLPFKCLYCTYNVSRRHLLHQHLRVHHNQEGKTEIESEKKEEIIPPKPPEEEKKPSEMPDIPLVWVYKFGSFLKMFKCRWCPHVNARKTNIQEHERMHQPEELKKLLGPGRCWIGLQCRECNYSCRNAGVLASHMKVHNGFYGEVRSLFDPTRSESEQLRELEDELKLKKPKDTEEEEEEDNNNVEKEGSLSPQPEEAYTRCQVREMADPVKKTLNFCDRCPARFFYKKELKIHSKFHMIHLPFRCSFCSYTARQRPHLLTHYRVHSQDYQEKTFRLKEIYVCSPEFPQPKTKIIIKSSPITNGPVWVVKSSKEMKPLRKFSCDRCPAKFFKLPGLQYHLTLHGSAQRHKCPYCDYSVKAYANLVKHQFVHEKNKPKKNFSYSFRVSGVDVNQSQDTAETEQQEKEEEPELTIIIPSDDAEKVKKKKYKCEKCPMTFEKQSQYEDHVSLHGSNYRYRCDRCDYSVKYHACFTQHMKNHKNEEVKTLIPEFEELLTDDKKEFELTLAERQMMLLQKRKKSVEEKNQNKRLMFCGYCPYSVNRRDLIDSHTWSHFLVSGIKSLFECPYCDFSTAETNTLQEHTKLHFNSSARYKAEAYLKCEKIELWGCEEGAEESKQFLVFQDKGQEEVERFFPLTEPEESNQQDDDMIEDGIGLEEEVEDIEEIEEIEEVDGTIMENVGFLLPKPRKHRGKNWRCQKCPHAFGKRDQYLRHVSLHGSNQKHRCDICDYSVKFYTNYVQHMKMHQLHEPNRVISVKKNYQSLIESSRQILAAASFLEGSHEGLENFKEYIDEDNTPIEGNLVIDDSDQGQGEVHPEGTDK